MAALTPFCLRSHHLHNYFFKLLTFGSVCLVVLLSLSVNKEGLGYDVDFLTEGIDSEVVLLGVARLGGCSAASVILGPCMSWTVTLI